MSTRDDRGWVKPVDGGIDISQMDPIEPTHKTNSSRLLAGLVLAALVFTAIGATVLWRNLSSDPFASAHSVPADMDYVVTFDALALSDSERLQAFVDAFAVPLVDAEMIETYPEDLVLAIDEAIEEELGITLSDDLLPWIGRSMSIAGTVPTIADPMAFQSDDLELAFIVSADVRDRGAAEAFVGKMLDLARESGSGVTSTEIAGQPGHRIAVSDGSPDGAVVVTETSLLFGTEDEVASALGAKDSGLSMADDAGFRDAMNRLPSERMVSFYVAPSAIEAVTALGTAGMPQSEGLADPPLPSQGLAVSVALIDEGLLVSYVLPNVGAEAVAISPDAAVLASLPKDTLGFLSIASEAGATQTQLDNELFADLGYPLDAWSDELGIDLVSLFESFSGNMTFAATETRNSSIADATDVPVGVVAALGLNASGPMKDLVAMLEEMMTDQGLTFDTAGSVTTVGADGQELVSYSIEEGLAVVGTGSKLVGTVASGGEGGLLQTEQYIELENALVGDGLLMYVDVARIVDLAPMTSNESATLDPFRGVGLGADIDDQTMLMEVLFLIDY